jgi:ribosome-associated protein
MAEELQVTPEVAIPFDELEFRVSRSSGPGGQSVNTTDSRVELRFDLAGTNSIPPEAKQRALHRLASRLDSAGRLRVVAQTQRSQLLNRREATERLAAMLASAITPPRTRRPTRPTAAARARRAESKRRRASTKRLRQRPPPDRGD